MRIIEFPRYGTFAESFANTIPFSEAIGFVTYVDPGTVDQTDIPFYVTAHETAHQWWAHQVMSANVEGGTSIVESLAQYSALMVMKHRYGADGMKKFMRYELNNYLRGRAQERNEEPPLYRVDANQGYIHYGKGAMVMYEMQDYIGEDNVNKALAEFTKAFAFQGSTVSRVIELDVVSAEVHAGGVPVSVRRSLAERHALRQPHPFSQVLPVAGRQVQGGVWWSRLISSARMPRDRITLCL